MTVFDALHVGMAEWKRSKQGWKEGIVAKIYGEVCQTIN
jgi:hypothetical protein